MTDLHHTEIIAYLDSYGWKYQTSAPQTISTAFKGEDEENEFNLIIKLSEHWVALTVWPYVFSVKPERFDEIARAISLINFNEMKMARFAQNERGEIVLCLDLPIQGLSEPLFHWALDAISYFAEVFYTTFVEMSDPTD